MNKIKAIGFKPPLNNLLFRKNVHYLHIVAELENEFCWQSLEEDAEIFNLVKELDQENLLRVKAGNQQGTLC